MTHTATLICDFHNQFCKCESIVSGTTLESATQNVQLWADGTEKLMISLKSPTPEQLGSACSTKFSLGAWCLPSRRGLYATRTSQTNNFFMYTCTKTWSFKDLQQNLLYFYFGWHRSGLTKPFALLRTSKDGRAYRRSQNLNVRLQPHKISWNFDAHVNNTDQWWETQCSCRMW